MLLWIHLLKIISTQALWGVLSNWNSVIDCYFLDWYLHIILLWSWLPLRALKNPAGRTCQNGVRAICPAAWWLSPVFLVDHGKGYNHCTEVPWWSDPENFGTRRCSTHVMAAAFILKKLGQWCWTDLETCARLLLVVRSCIQGPSCSPKTKKNLTLALGKIADCL